MKKQALDEELLQCGVHMAVAIHLYQEGTISLGRAAQLSNVPLELFIEKASQLGLLAADYSSKEINKELTELEKHCR